MDLLTLRTFALRVLCALALLTPVSWAAPNPPPNEYALKSVFLYNFCRFIEWPASAFSSPDEPLTIGILGHDPFGSLLEEAIAGENYHGRPIRIAHFRNARDITRCHILFVSSSEAARTAEILSAVAGRNIVTVGETDIFIDQGGMIAVTADRGRVRLRINPPSLRAAKVDVSSKLLRIAETKI